MRILLGLAGILFACSAASAAGGLDCDAKDKKVAFNVQAGITHGMGGAIFSFQGRVEIKDKSSAADLRKTSVSMEHVAQYWLDEKDLRLASTVSALAASRTAMSHSRSTQNRAATASVTTGLTT